MIEVFEIVKGFYEISSSTSVTLSCSGSRGHSLNYIGIDRYSSFTGKLHWDRDSSCTGKLH